MQYDNEILNNHTTRVRQLLLLHKEMRRENEALREQIAEKDRAIEQLRQETLQLKEGYKNLKTARILQVSDGDIQATKARIGKLIQDVNRSLTLLSN